MLTTDAAPAAIWALTSSGPKRGSTIHAVTAHPSSVIRTVEPIMNHQLQSTRTNASGSSSCADSWVSPCSSGSRLVTTRFALKPPATPTKTAASPASGARFMRAKIAAASGGSTT